MGKITQKEFNARVQTALNLNEKKIKSFLPIDPKSRAALENANSQLCGGCAAFLSFLACNVAVAINVAGYINVALAANVAVGVNIAVAVNITVEINVGQINKQKLLFEHDSFINSIAVNLGNSNRRLALVPAS
jgi:hypothetical protein